MRLKANSAISPVHLYAKAEGIDHVFINGVEIVRRGEHSRQLPSKVLRFGKDTKTVAMDALRQKVRLPEISN